MPLAKQLIAAGERTVLPRPLRGKGLERSADTALLASALAPWPEIGRSTPLKSGFRRQRAPKSTAPSAASTLELPEGSVNFGFDLASWHDTDNLVACIAEAARASRPAAQKRQPGTGLRPREARQYERRSHRSAAEKVYPEDFLTRMAPRRASTDPPPERRTRSTRHKSARAPSRAHLEEPRPPARTPVARPSLPPTSCPCGSVRSAAKSPPRRSRHGHRTE